MSPGSPPVTVFEPDLKGATHSARAAAVPTRYCTGKKTPGGAGTHTVPVPYRALKVEVSKLSAQVAALEGYCSDEHTDANFDAGP